VVNGVSITRVEIPKASSVLAAELRERILAQEIREGTVLPNERQLAEAAGLSRASVREALRILEVEGLIITRLGRNGGSSARRPSREAMVKSVNLFIRGQNILFRSLLETREAIEPACARLAAQHRSLEDILELESLHTRLEAAYADVPAFLGLNAQWHLAVTRASHNELLIAFVLAISDALHAGTDLENFNSDEVRSAVLRAHRRVMDAIRDRDDAAAARRMARHVGAYVAHVHARMQAMECR
jgi:DNA-binding FadR family transcriptional regulator